MKGYTALVSIDSATIISDLDSTQHVVTVPGIEITDILSSGANGIVFKGIDSLDRPVAVKVFPPRVDRSASTSTLLEKARAEAQKLNNIRHPRIPIIYWFGTTPYGWPIAVMDFIPGRPLREALTTIVDDFEARAQFLGEVFEILEHAQQVGVLHGDIHGGNILVGDGDGRPYVIDFGTSLLAGRKKSHERHARLLLNFTYEILPELRKGFPRSDGVNALSGFEVLPYLKRAFALFRRLWSQAARAPHPYSADAGKFISDEFVAPQSIGAEISQLLLFDVGLILDLASRSGYSTYQMDLMRRSIVTNFARPESRPSAAQLNSRLQHSEEGLSAALKMIGGVPDGKWFKIGPQGDDLHFRD